MQIFQDGKLLFSSTWRDKQAGRKMAAYYTSDGSFSFDVNTIMEGDVLIRCRRESWFGLWMPRVLLLWWLSLLCLSLSAAFFF